ncbi:hypothetical protein DOTSEDRAFT_23926 [Dothistroma septosporum NZE10]|uniref:Uncharacterized protein n=1 Tax=Dothistroma septosporum (strain NZE10 / CBS 128990) TaxID=675120 RepID=N1PKD3_DOTSN|nr:hypothetical protein DOTSEDRAFT_23926 [Dothistroma septosporum NZE10]
MSRKAPPTLEEVRECLSWLGQRRSTLRQQVDEAYLHEQGRHFKVYETLDGSRRLREAQQAHRELQEQLIKVAAAYLKWESVERDMLDAMNRNTKSRSLPSTARTFGGWFPAFLRWWQAAPSPQPAQPPPSPQSSPSPRAQPVSTPAPPPQSSWPVQPTVVAWREQCAAAFADYASLEAFPIPPANSFCTNQACQQDGHVLPLCKCQVRHTLSQVSNLNLKQERLSWHPDRFAVCAENMKVEFQSMATEIFVIVMDMLQGE